MVRLLILGGSGAGTSTLGRALASARASQHFDVDDFFWHPSDPPFQERRDEGERVMLMRDLFLPRRDWVLSGSPIGWADRDLVPRLTHVVLLTLSPEERLRRLEERETRRYGAPGAEERQRQRHHAAFMDWARGYDAPDFDGRSRAGQEAWLAGLALPVLRLDANAPLPALLQEVQGWLGQD
ncbi:hypothetical protein FGG78_22675 [Thioclava sp. BHET1]|nr:hypothetical protein FGG78_22675 [Thioclava sp. BHET1]